MSQSRNGWCLQLGLASSLVMNGAIANSGDFVLAKITLDDTLGTESFVFTPNIVIHGLPGEQIDGGAIRYPNLFHSFHQFKLNIGGQAFFTSPAGIKNIVGRVTAGSRSDLLSNLPFANSLPPENGLRLKSLFSPPEYILRLISLKCHATASGTGTDQIYLHVKNRAVGSSYVMKAGDEVNLNPVTEISFNSKVLVELFYQDSSKSISLGSRRVSSVLLPEALQFNRHPIANYTLNYQIVSSGT